MKRAFFPLLGCVASIWVLFPIYLVVVTVFDQKDQVYAWPKSFFPSAFSVETIKFFFAIPEIANSTFNSVKAAFLTMLFAIGLGAPAGYAMARYDFQGKWLYRIILLTTRAFPVALLALPLAVRFNNLGIYDTIFGVSLVHTALALPFSVLITYSLFLGIPYELEEASWTLGCSKIKSFLYIVMPIALPGLASTAIFSFIISWNEVFAAAILTTQERTLPAYLLTSLNESPLHLRFVGGFFIILPALFFIFVVRKYLFSMWGIANR
jgi:multiple sugar transport system permease protein